VGLRTHAPFSISSHEHMPSCMFCSNQALELRVIQLEGEKHRNLWTSSSSSEALATPTATNYFTTTTNTAGAAPVASFTKETFATSAAPSLDSAVAGGTVAGLRGAA